ncbi:MAG: hypothetical protein NWE93_10880 [Candidatus Bathyarchaeota archaeon]|nr:hypothetical protein [Candidatus Bathyarchaeota archaeon]
METMFPCPNENKIQKILEVKKMTSKKTKNNELTHKTDFTKYRPKEAVKMKNQNTKRIETFLPVSNEEDTKK